MGRDDRRLAVNAASPEGVALNAAEPLSVADLTGLLGETITPAQA